VALLHVIVRAAPAREETVVRGSLTGGWSVLSRLLEKIDLTVRACPASGLLVRAHAAAYRERERERGAVLRQLREPPKPKHGAGRASARTQQRVGAHRTTRARSTRTARRVLCYSQRFGRERRALRRCSCSCLGWALQVKAAEQVRVVHTLPPRSNTLGACDGTVLGACAGDALGAFEGAARC
jgi:hypothetical protein